jgi:5'-nucleotidase
LIAQAAVGTDQIGRFDFTIDDDTNTVVEWKWELVPITEDLCEPDRDLERFIATFKDEIDRTYSRILSKLKRKLTHPQREIETEIGNLFADILLTAGRLDLVLLGSGSIRQPDLGPLVTLGDLSEIFTFDGPLYRVSITGERLLHVFAHAMRKENRVPGESNCFQVNHGVVAVYDDSAAQLVSLSIGGEPVDPAREYAVCIQDYTLSSCDALLGVTTDELGPAKVIATSSRDVLNEFLTANQLADAVVEGRLVYQG